MDSQCSEMMNWFRTMCSRMAAWRFENTNTSGEYELLFTTNRILDVSQVESLLFWKNACEDEDGEDAQYILNDFYEVPFN